MLKLCECSITAIMLPSQGRDGGSTPLTRSICRLSSFGRAIAS